MQPPSFSKRAYSDYDVTDDEIKNVLQNANQSALTLTPAQDGQGICFQVLAIQELKEQILQHSDKNDLRNFLMVSKQ